jgi:hypothetical protein
VAVEVAVEVAVAVGVFVTQPETGTTTEFELTGGGVSSESMAPTLVTAPQAFTTPHQLTPKGLPQVAPTVQWSMPPELVQPLSQPR